MSVHLVATVRIPAGNQGVRQFSGFPPELNTSENGRVPLPPARFLVIEEKPSGVFLYRYADDGRFAGDTWHRSVEDAKYQAAAEYKDSVGEWRQVPEDVADALAFAIEQEKTRDATHFGR